jgi:dUTP pyrophosphatase
VTDGLDVEIKRLPHGSGLPLPTYQTAGSAGMDLHAATEDDFEIAPGEVRVVPCGFSLAIPPGFEGQVRPRSGIALRHRVTVLNAPGTIDSDYRGELGVLLINHGTDVFRVERGMRIAQFVIAPVQRAQWIEVPELPGTARGAGGYGHTGS